MNEIHLQFLASPEWAASLDGDLLPWLTAVADLGDDVLEIGPGPGLTTDLLRRLVPRITAVELDEELAASLAARLGGTGVEVLHADARRTGLESDRFSAATCFTMLHHVPTAVEQDEILAEASRVLRPGGVLVGVDAVDSELIRLGHVDDIFVPVDPDTFGTRLEAAGFADISVDVVNDRVRFVARNP